MNVELPPLHSNYLHAVIESVEIGPRRAIVLGLRTMEWHGSQGEYREPHRLRFGGISNLEDVRQFFALGVPIEIAWLRYASNQTSKPGELYFEIEAERTDDSLLIRCQHLQYVAADPTLRVRIWF